MARSRSLAVAEARPCAFVFRALLLYRRVLICPCDSFQCHVHQSRDGSPAMSSCCVHPTASVPKHCIRELSIFVHCIVHFPCTLLQVVIALNIFYFATARVILCTCSVLTFTRAQVVLWITSSTSCLHYAAGGGGYLMAILLHVHSYNPLYTLLHGSRKN